ncbi:molybdopterin-guanine dinucleotide biosynthesis protein A [Sphingomonas vulcanisoli]|uniref:Molybdenum cofactor guanylyltransferase n=1 Tax=Sphingomonas vulcanisoli TaxID=1658060 RepID=A0ABX0TSE3_9SPHN|nr:molybdenum cofactor guanylyltransferase [Sphingomonas vulcanisoli]NIJ08417.1 molybdopterin-guanine dinucleotide biosynthesis protein A [Sphingomonas vulcanisoli]
MRLLGAVLAGGRSRRFGSDKAMALLDGYALLDWATRALEEHVEQIVLCGREGGLADRPAPDLGPLGGLNAAVHFGWSNGFDAVLSVPCDTPAIPTEAVTHLLAAEAPAYLSSCPVVGLWPCALYDRLDTYLCGEDRSMRGWANHIGATPLATADRIANINTSEDLDALTAMAWRTTPPTGSRTRD